MRTGENIKYRTYYLPSKMINSPILGNIRLMQIDMHNFSSTNSNETLDMTLHRKQKTE